MNGDDYDSDAYQRLKEELIPRKVMLSGKGLIGRHNDNTQEIVAWFLQRYRAILKEDFGREELEQAK